MFSINSVVFTKARTKEPHQDLLQKPTWTVGFGGPAWGDRLDEQLAPDCCELRPHQQPPGEGMSTGCEKGRMERP